MMKKIENIFVDCFDTILGRKVKPNDIKRIWAEKAVRLFDFAISAKQLYYIRLQVEQELVNINTNNGRNGEYSIFDVYNAIIQRLEMINAVDKIGKITNEELLELEINVELNYQFVIVKTVKKLIKYKKMGCKVFLMSDFYMPQNIVKVFLKKQNILYLFDDIIISIDNYANKRTGTLYKYVLDKYKFNPCKCLMIGDNKFSDFLMARKNCFNSKKISNIIRSINLNSKSFVYNKFFKKIFLSKNYNFDNFAFPLFQFCDNLFMECKKKKIDKLYFLSREGQFLKQIFDMYCEIFNCNIKTYYLLVSRNSTFMPSLDSLEKENFEMLFRQYNTLSINDFLLSLSFNSKEIAEIEKLLGFDLNIKIKNFNKSLEFAKLKETDYFVLLFNKKRSEQKKLFNDYLKQLNFDYKEKTLNIVDVGWKGTMQDNVYKIFSGDLNINGFYLGLLSAGKYSSNSKKYGLVFDFVKNGCTISNRILSTNYHYYESLLRANHSRVDGYIKNKDNKIDVIYEESPDTDFYNTYLKTFHLDLLNKFQLICNIIKKNNIYKDVFESLLPYLYLKILSRINNKDYKLINASLHSFREGFGNIAIGLKAQSKFKKLYLMRLKSKIKLLLMRLGVWGNDEK